MSSAKIIALDLLLITFQVIKLILLIQNLSFLLCIETKRKSLCKQSLRKKMLQKEGVFDWAFILEFHQVLRMNLNVNSF